MRGLPMEPERFRAVDLLGPRLVVVLDRILTSAFAGHAITWTLYESKLSELWLPHVQAAVTGKINDIEVARYSAAGVSEADQRLQGVLRQVAYRLQCPYCSAPEWVAISWALYRRAPWLVGPIAAYGVHIALLNVRRTDGSPAQSGLP